MNQDKTSRSQHNEKLKGKNFESGTRERINSLLDNPHISKSQRRTLKNLLQRLEGSIV